MNKKILYTTVFGNYDDVIEPKLPNGWDWKYFSEDNSLSLYSDDCRNAKRFKVLIFIEIPSLQQWAKQSAQRK